MKTIEVDEDLYRYIASHTLHIGESASDILRRMLNVKTRQAVKGKTVKDIATVVASTAVLGDRIHTMCELLLSEKYVEQKRVINRFMLVLSTLYRIAPAEFLAATGSLQGRTRVYFAVDKQTLLQHGVHTKPQSVPGTPYWVITNTNSGRKRSMVGHIMSMMQFPTELIGKVCSTI